MARRDEGAYYWYVTEEQRSQPGLKILHILDQDEMCRGSEHGVFGGHRSAMKDMCTHSIILLPRGPSSCHC